MLSYLKGSSVFVIWMGPMGERVSLNILLCLDASHITFGILLNQWSTFESITRFNWQIFVVSLFCFLLYSLNGAPTFG